MDFHSSLYCTVPFCPSIYAYIIVTLRESVESLERECGLCFVWKSKMSLGFLLCNISDLQCGESYACLSSLLANNDLGTDYSERLVFPYENTACRNCKKTFALAQIYIVAMSIP